MSFSSSESNTMPTTNPSNRNLYNPSGRSFFPRLLMFFSIIFNLLDPMFGLARHPYVENIKLHDCGRMSHQCSHCYALHWIDERVGSTLSQPEFSLCCRHNKVILPLLSIPPPQLQDLLLSQSTHAKEFRKHIVQYNHALAFTSIGVKQDHSVDHGKGPPIFRIHGELKHWEGALLPHENSAPTYAQLYVFDPQIALNYRMARNTSLDRTIMSSLQSMLLEFNPYSRIYRHAFEVLKSLNVPEYSVKICVAPGQRNLHNNTPTADEVAVILPDSSTYEADTRDIILRLRSNSTDNNSSESTTENDNPSHLQRISEGHAAYAPLHYVLLFPRGEPGWHWNMSQSDGNRLTLRQFSAFRLHSRHHEFSTILLSGRLLQHYIVDMYAAIDQARLRWYRLNQDQLRLTHLQGMEDAVNRQDDHLDMAHIGRRVILPSSYSGGPRDHYQRFQDSMAIARFFKKIDIFLTLTANANWKEITRELLPGQTAADRPDLVARVFKIKKDALLKLITKNGIFGKCVAHIYVIEFQKRGLPHAHFLIFLDHDFRLSTPAAVDETVWARWPNPDTQPKLFEYVKKFMLHGPCGRQHPNSPCMENGKCRFGFPKPYQDRTTLSDDGYPNYYRPNDGRSYHINGFDYTNQWIATYNPFCLMTIGAHVNIECVWSFWTTKYLNKYIQKGPDSGTLQLIDENDEIQRYIEGRYFSAAEGAWRIYAFDMHGQTPSVTRLPVHLPDDPPVVFDPEEDYNTVVERAENTKTPLTAFFVANRDQGILGEKARKFTYQEFPLHFTFKKYPKKHWAERLQQPSIGRMVYVSPTAGERFYLRILLSVVRGPRSFADLLRFNGQRYNTFREACIARGLLEDDGEWNICLEQAVDLRTGQSLRHLFATILLFSNPISPARLWEKFKESICDDLPYRLRTMGFLSIAREEVYDYGLYLLNEILQESNRTLENCNMPRYIYDWGEMSTNKLISQQLAYNREEEQSMANDQINSLNNDQHDAFNNIWDSISTEKGGCYFIDGWGGTGKTYLYRTLCHAVRAQGWIILCVASTGLAALLLPGGQTAHSMFKIPIATLDEHSFCDIPKEGQRARLLRMTRAIIYDECLMNHKLCFEAVDRTLRDLRDTPEKPYGGITTIHGGDFQQILPVIVRGSREDIVNASIQRSYLWNEMAVIKLRQNMRLDATAEEQKFARWLIEIGHGSNTDENGLTKLPENIVNEDCEEFLTKMYGEAFDLPSMPHPDFFHQRAILAPRNTDVKETNATILKRMPGEELLFESADDINMNPNAAVNESPTVPLEYLRSLEPATLPPSDLRLKIGCPLILLRNLQPAQGLCNGTRMTLLRAQSRVLEVRIMGGDHDGKIALIPRILMLPSTEEGYTFQFKRRQFPVKLAFAMTINKAEGQSLQHVGIDLRVPVFSHGQLYVALSRATSSKRVQVLLPPNSNYETMNVVYPEVLLD